MSTPYVQPVAGCSARLLPGTSIVEVDHAAEIDVAWRAALSANPAMFNGRILLGERVTLHGDSLDVSFREVAFATLIWLRASEPSPPPLFNVFGAAMLVSRDGAALLGRMAPHTANAGQVYFPCGTPDLDDVRGGQVDLEGSIVRELAEETGLAAPVVRPTARAVVVRDGSLVGFFRRFETDLDAVVLSARAAAHLATEREPELDRILLVRSAGELGTETPRYAKLALGALLKD